MGQYSFPGERPPQSQALDFGGQIPWHRGPEKDQCVIHPVRRVYVCTPEGREEHIIPGRISCSCGGDHSEGNPCDTEPELNEWAEEIPGWTVQKAFRRSV